MAFVGSQNIDPALRQASLTSPSKGRDGYPNGTQPTYSPLQPSPNTSYPGLQTPTYYSIQPTQESADEQSPANPHDPNDIKRPRACEACRQLKVKCELDDNSPSSSCKRCAKAGRQCIVTAPSRKRQKKTDSRVAELEKKIDALTATLAARGETGNAAEADMALDPAIAQSAQSQPVHRAPTYPEHWPGGPPPPPPSAPPAHQSSPGDPRGLKRKATGGYPDYFGPEIPRTTSSNARSPPATYYPAMFSAEPPTLKQTSGDLPMVDVIDQGLIDSSTAKRCFERYMNEMCFHLPIVVFPSGTKAEDVRRNKPLLFLAILAVGSGTIRPDVQPKLTTELTKILADRVVYRGEKSLELVQTIQCMTTFYQPPERYEELNFNQLIHIAAVMALDIGMGKRFKKSNLALWRPYTEQKKTLPDPNSAETRRCWLGCYYMCSNSSMSLRRPLLLRWSAYADECIEILTNAPDAAPTDKWLCLLVKAQHIAEEIGFEFSMDDPASQLSLTDSKTQYHLKGFERKLQDWHESASKDMLKRPIMQHTEGIVSLYMHEIAMHHNHNIDDFRPPFNTTPIDGPPDPDLVTPAHIESLTTCLRAVHSTFDAFLSMDVKSLRSLPTLFFVRNSYAAVALIKMYTAVSAKGSKFGSIIETDDLKVDFYLDCLITTLSKTSEGGMCKVAYKFSLIFNMLKQWHVKRVDAQSGENSNPSSRTRTPAMVHKGGGGISMQGQPQQQQPLQPQAFKAIASQQDPNTLGWNPQARNSVDAGSQQVLQSRNGLQMLSDAAMAPPGAPNQQQQQQQQTSNTMTPQQHQQQQHQQQQQQQQAWLQQQQQHQQRAPPLGQMVPQANMTDVNGLQDPNGLMLYGGLPGQDFGNMDLDLMAYGFGDEFMAMNFGLEQGGWAF